DYDALAKAWEAGDEQQGLCAEEDEHYRQLAEKAIYCQEAKDKGIHFHAIVRDEEEAKARVPQMLFVTLDNTHELLPDVASRWKKMLWNGGIEVNVYEVTDSELLDGLQKRI
ncbi:hypothetical protein GN958_ATG08002, partial [Phytophthora infestans]